MPHQIVSRLVLTGEVDRRYAVRLHLPAGEIIRVTLPGRPFMALNDLVVARLCTSHGRSTLPNVIGSQQTRTTAIYELRRAFDDALEVDGGLQLVESHYWNEYSLNLPSSSLAIEPLFADLSPRHLPQEVVARIIAALDRAA